MSRSAAILSWLDDKSDWLSPLVVKEVRQVVRGREFNYSFNATVVTALAVAFFGAADALTGSGTSGRWAFTALMGCLAIVGLAVVPLGAFSALRNERLEQTLELITVTALSPRRIVVGKLLAQGVKLATLFSAIAPFVTMSFLLGGIDFVTILLALVTLFVWSLWACAVCLFLSTLFKSRAMSGLVFGLVGIVLFLVFAVVRPVFFAVRYGVFPGGPAGFAGAGPQWWWVFGITTTFWVVSMGNLVLLAENRLSAPADSRVTALRVGFFVQFLAIIAWILPFIDDALITRLNAAEALGVIGGLHLAMVATFTVTEDLVLSRRVLLRLEVSPPWGRLVAMFRPGGGRGALYVLVQMSGFVGVAWLLQLPWPRFRWVLAICAYICFFTGVPTLVCRYLKPSGAASLKLRVTVLVLLPASMLLPDLIHYLLWQPGGLDLTYSARHLVNPFRTLANWTSVETRQWSWVPLVLGLPGLLAYVALIVIGTRVTAEAAAVDSKRAATAAGEPGSANILY